MVDYKEKNMLARIRDMLFLVCYFIFLLWRLFTRVTYWRQSFSFFEWLNNFALDLYLNKLTIMLLVCIVIGLFATKPKIGKILMYAALVFVGKRVAEANEDVYFYHCVLLILAANGVSVRKILRATLCINIPLLTATVVASQRGIIENTIELYRNREYLGYTWTTTPVMIFSYSVFVYLILRKGKINLVEYVLLNAINYWFFYKTNTRFAFLIVTLCLAFFMVYRNFFSDNRRYNFERNSLVALPWCFFVLIYTLSAFFNVNSKLYVSLNRLLSNRLQQCQYSLGKYGFTVFGQAITWVTYSSGTADNPATYVDTAYLQNYLKFGFVSILVLLFLSSYIMYRSYKEDKYYVGLVFAFILVFGLFEQQLYWLEYDALLLLPFADWKSLSKLSKPETMRLFNNGMTARQSYVYKE